MNRFSFGIAAMLVSVSFHTSAFAFESGAASAYMLDAETGEVLYEKAATERRPTASLSKVMTAYVVFRSLADEKVALSDTFRISKKAWKTGGSRMFVDVNTDVAIEDLLQGLIVQSGNDAAVALAEGIGGTEEFFAGRMNEVVRELGLENSNFVTPHGLDHPEHYSTTRDMAILARELVTRFPQYYHFYSQKEYTYNNIRQPNRNPLLYRGIGVDGMKTGYTSKAGYGLIASGERDGRRVVMAMMGLPTPKARAEEGLKLVEYGLREFVNVRVAETGSVVSEVPVELGVVPAVSVVAVDEAVVTLPRSLADQVEITRTISDKLAAPVSAGQEVGEIRAKIPGREDIVVALHAADDVAQLDWWGRTKVWMGSFF